MICLLLRQSSLWWDMVGTLLIRRLGAQTRTTVQRMQRKISTLQQGKTRPHPKLLLIKRPSVDGRSAAYLRETTVTISHGTPVHRTMDKSIHTSCRGCCQVAGKCRLNVLDEFFFAEFVVAVVVVLTLQVKCLENTAVVTDEAQCRLLTINASASLPGM